MEQLGRTGDLNPVTMQGTPMQGTPMQGTPMLSNQLKTEDDQGAQIWYRFQGI